MSTANPANNEGRRDRSRVLLRGCTGERGSTSILRTVKDAPWRKVWVRLLATSKARAIRRRPAPLPGLDPIAATVALEAARFDAELSAKAAAYLDEQADLVRLQKEHLHEQREVQLSHLKLRRTGERFKVALQFLLTAAATCLALVVLALVWGAAHDHGLVVEAFSVSPDLAQRGLTGQVVAEQVLDHLSDLQAQSMTMRAGDTYRNNWGEDLKVEIPETGISLGELRRYLRDRLGHETRISGEVYRTSGGLTVAARVGAAPAKRFTGPDADIDGLTGQAAEAIFARTQPYRYAAYLRKTNRIAEALAVLQALAHGGDPLERAWGHVGLGGLLGMRMNDYETMAAENRQALIEVPGFAPALIALRAAEASLGHDEAGLSIGRQLLDATDSIKRNVMDDSSSYDIMTTIISNDYYTGDVQRRIRDLIRFSKFPDLSSGPGSVSGEVAEDVPPALALAHDLNRARSTALRLSPGDSERAFVLGYVALERGDPSSIAFFQQNDAIDAALPNGREMMLRTDAAYTALALARFGRLAEAQALIASTPTDCYLCVTARGTVAAAGGDHAGALRWFAEAVRQGPDLPHAYIDRGAARLRWGDLGGAIDDARAANRAGPHDPDALKLWGDALAREGHWSDALRKYKAALIYAPAWGEARQAAAQAAQRS